MKPVVRCQLLMLLASIFFSNIAHATIVDFTDGAFTTVTNSGINDEPVIFSEQSEGVTLTMESTLNLVGTERFINIRPGVSSNGLQLGGGGGSTISFTLSSDKEITLDSYSTDNSGFFLGSPTFNVTGGAVSSLGNSLLKGNNTNLFNGGALSLLAGELYTFELQGTGAGTQAFIDSFKFTQVSNIPVPAAVWLFGSGLLCLLGVRKKQPA